MTEVAPACPEMFALDTLAQEGPAERGFLRSAWFAAGDTPADRVLIAGDNEDAPLAGLAFDHRRIGPLSVKQVAGSYWPFRGIPLAPRANRESLARALRTLRSEIGRIWRIGPLRADDPEARKLLDGARAAGWRTLERPVGQIFEIDLKTLKHGGTWPSSRGAQKNRWRGRQIIPRSFVEAARTTPAALKDLPVVRDKQYPRASSHYGLLWWNNADGTLKSVPRETYWSWGLYDSLIVVIPPLDIVIARAGKSFKGGWDAGYDKLAGFFGPVVASVRSKGGDASPSGPRKASSAIARLTWAPAKTIVRLAPGSDNWPITWGDDDRLYTAYGDGWGFAPKVKGKLSLGLARVEGTPPKITGVNVRSATGEKKGDGPRGVKASGILMVDGVLHLWW
ncbi:MAG: hypothetical protein CMN65_10425, partial [Sphingomonadaceae bacterium]|nr:hypothetical protein [Sphingomonadaceae bacterium]